MFKEVWDTIKKPIMEFLQYTISFAFPVLCVVISLVLSFVYFNFWLMFFIAYGLVAGTIKLFKFIIRFRLIILWLLSMGLMIHFSRQKMFLPLLLAFSVLCFSAAKIIKQEKMKGR